MTIDIQGVLSKLSKVKRSGKGWVACCPAHNDKNPSLSIGENDGKVLLKCFAGCSYPEVAQALGINTDERIGIKIGKTANRKTSKLVATYDYTDENGNVLYQAVRFEPKNFMVRRPTNEERWEWNLQGINRVPFRLPDLFEARKRREPVFICEGEKDATKLKERFGVTATTTVQGSNGWSNDYAEFFDGLDVVVLPDNDAPGRKYAQQVALSLWGTANTIRVVTLPGLDEKGDVTDWIENGGSLEKLGELVLSIPEWNPDDSPEISDEVRVPDFSGGSNTFIIKSANEWIEEAKHKPPLKMLFGEFWHEGEICILFADTNLGKSIVAVQIADSISRGESVKPLTLEAERQKVLYFDFELSDRQFTERYSEKKTGHYHNPYRFSDELLRVEINPNGATGDNFAEYEESLISSIEAAIQKTDAKVLIVDNLTYLRSDNEKANDALPLMKELKALKERFGLSLLVLAHTPKRDVSRPITNNDLQGSKMLSNFCDSIFAIGSSSNDSHLRYLKQTKSRQTGIVYDAENVCVGEIRKDTNFLKFDFLGFGTEREHLANQTDNDRQAEMHQVIELDRQGKTQREISRTIGFSIGKVNKLLQEAKEMDAFTDDYVQNVHPLYDVNNLNNEQNEGEDTVAAA